MKSLEWVLYASLIVFAVSLVLPGFVFKPSLIANPKYAECAAAMSRSIPLCDVFSFGKKEGTNCFGENAFDAESNVRYYNTVKDHLVDPEKIRAYCEGYDVPLTSTRPGYKILLLGWIGPLLGMFAWYANVLWIVALAMGFYSDRWKLRFAYSIGAVVLGLQSFNFREYPLDEGGVKILTVDHLGAGFYVWEVSFAIVLLHVLLVMLRKQQTKAM